MSRAEKTRMILLDAALASFVQRGVRATTLEYVAASANLTRGAVYWHFSDKQALVLAVFESLVWPFDIGSDIERYRKGGNPLLMLGELLEQQMRDCLADIHQRRMMEVVIRHRSTAELPDALNARLEGMVLQALQHLSAALDIADGRGELRPGLTPIYLAHCVIAACIGVIAESLDQGEPASDGYFHLVPRLVLAGAGVSA